MESSVQVCLLDIAFQVAEQNGWKTDQGSDDHLMVHLPTRHGNAYIHVYWHEMADMLTLRIPIPFPRPVPEYAVAELCVLLNLVNERCIAGSWYYISDEDDTRIVWREEVYTDQSLVTTEQMDHISLLLPRNLSWLRLMVNSCLTGWESHLKKRWSTSTSLCCLVQLKTNDRACNARAVIYFYRVLTLPFPSKNRMF